MSDDLVKRLQDMVDFKHDDMDVAREAIEEIARLRGKVDAVYSERNRLAAALARMALAAGFSAGKGVDPDETKWPVVYVDTPNGQVSWHIAEADAHVLKGLPQYGKQWDGTFKARDAAWPVWPVTDLVATARREGMEEIEQERDEFFNRLGRITDDLGLPVDATAQRIIEAIRELVANEREACASVEVKVNVPEGAEAWTPLETWEEALIAFDEAFRDAIRAAAKKVKP